MELLAEADGNRTRLVEMLDHVSFEDRGGHQAPIRLRCEILELPSKCRHTPWLVTAIGRPRLPVEAS